MYSQQARVSIINPDFNFNKMGIGGLDNEFNAIFRRAFASRVFPQEIIEQLGKIKSIKKTSFVSLAKHLY